jgi:cytochrome P450
MTVEQSSAGGSLAAPPGCPAHVPPEQFRHFDYIRDIETATTPYDGYLQYRGEKPFWSDVDGGFWVLTDAAQVRDCFLDPETFSNRNIGLGYTAFPRTMIPDQLDPPEHTKYRKLLLPYFPPRLRAAVPGTSCAVPQVPPETTQASAARRVPAAAPPAALATPTASSTTAAPATTAARRMRPRIAALHLT